MGKSIREIDFIKNPSEWPNIVLPMKKWHDDDLICGIIFSSMLTTVFLSNMFDIPKRLEDMKKVEYPTVEAMVADGWVVD